MMKTTMTTIVMTMIWTLMMNLITKKTSTMCINLMSYTLMTCLIVSMTMKLTPLSYIIFLTVIGGLMIMFLYLASTLWVKKEGMTKKMPKMFLIIVAPLMIKMMKISSNPMTTKPINYFEYNLSKITILIIILLTLMLMFLIEILTKTNATFRKKLKIWK